MTTPNNMLPKYIQLKEYLIQKINRAELEPGARVPSENVLASQFQLSRHTVRQALGDLENEGLIMREQGRGTFVSERKIKENRVIAVIVKSITNFIFPDIIYGIDKILNEAGYGLLLFISQNNPEKEAEFLKKAMQFSVDGLIIEPAKNTPVNGNQNQLQEFNQKKIPYLFIHSYWPELDPPHIILDDFKGGYLATQYLLQLGHKKIGGIFNIDAPQGVERLAGYKKALQENGIIVNSSFIGEYQYQTDFKSYPFQFMQEILRRNDRPSAIFCYNDRDAMRVVEAVRQAGLKIPDDLSIIGYNDSSLTTVSEIKLTSIKHPKEELGMEAARFIIGMIKGWIERPRLIYQPELIIRSSCKKVI